MYSDVTSFVPYFNVASSKYTTPRQLRRLSRITISLAFAFAALMQPAKVNADIITFDDLADGISVTNQYLGVTFSSSAGFENRTLGDAGSFGSSPPNHLLTAAVGGAYTGLNDTILDFSIPVNNLTFLGTAINTSGQVATVDVFVNSSLANSVGILGDGSPFTPDMVDLSAFNNVSRVVIHSVSDPGGLGWDDFQFTAVPEPSTFLLLGLGAVGALRLHRNRRR
jgi:hypothetical protein